MAKIYTKTGDKGTSSLASGRRISKSELIFEAYGTVDELNSAMGVLYRHIDDEKRQKEVYVIQNILFNIGAIMARDGADLPDYPSVTDKHIVALESAIDEMDEVLPALSSFILPGGCQGGAYAHLCRTICRRAERKVVSVEDEDFTTEVMYLNRLSDYLFTLSRYLNHKAKAEELTWNKTPLA